MSATRWTRCLKKRVPRVAAKRLAPLAVRLAVLPVALPAVPPVMMRAGGGLEAA